MMVRYGRSFPDKLIFAQQFPLSTSHFLFLWRLKTFGTKSTQVIAILFSRWYLIICYPNCTVPNIRIIFLLLYNKVIIHCIAHNYYTLTFGLHPSLQNSFTHMPTIVRIVLQYLIASISFRSKVHTTEMVLRFYNRTVK